MDKVETVLTQEAKEPDKLFICPTVHVTKNIYPNYPVALYV